MYFFEFWFQKGKYDCFHGNDKKMVISHTCFSIFFKHEVLFLAVNICRYIKLTANFWNMGLKMLKNDKFQFLDTPPTFEAQL